jgi:hypothetical protein
MPITSSRIPLQPYAQVFSITIAGLVYNMQTHWNNQPDTGWLLDISDANDVPILLGIPLVTGADLLEQYHYLGLFNGGYLLCGTIGNNNASPTYDNLGTDSYLYVLVPS